MLHAGQVRAGRSKQPLPPLPPSPPALSGFAATGTFQLLSARNIPRIAQLKADRLAEASDTTYATGAKHFDRFLAIAGTSIDNLAPGSPWPLVGEGFLVHLADHTKRDGDPLKSSAIASYMSHACSALAGNNLFTNTETFYEKTHHIFKGLIKRDALYFPPHRCSEKLALALKMILEIDTAAQRHSDPRTGAFFSMAAQFGFFLGLRPGDYAELSEPQNGHRLHLDCLYLIFDAAAPPIHILDRHLFPPNKTPKYVAILPDFAKNAQTGGAPMRACPCNPDPTGFCFPTNVMNFFSDPLNCPTAGERIFSRFPGGINMHAPLTAFLKGVASSLGLPAHLAHLHGFRAGIVEQLANQSDADKDEAGGWNHSKQLLGGRAPYIRTTLAWADRVAADLYNSSITSSFALQTFIHNTPSSSASRGP